MTRRGVSVLALSAMALLYLLVAFWMTWPVAAHAFTAVAGWPGDNLYFTWLVNWYYESLSHGRLPVHVPTLNVPDGWSLAYNEMTPVMALIGLPGFLVGGPAFAYNLTFWLSFVLSGLFTAIWIYRLTGHYGPAFVAGLIFAFAPYRLAHANGHLNLLGTQWLPLFFLCITELIRSGGRRWAVATAAAVVLLAGTSQYYLYMTGLIALPFLGVLLAHRPDWSRDTRFWRDMAVAGALAAPLVLLAVWPYVALARQGLLASHALPDVRVWSASPTDFLMPTPTNWLVGAWADSHFNLVPFWVESSVTPGLVAIVLATVGVLATRRTSARPMVATLGCGALVAFVLALGIDLHWFRQAVHTGIRLPLGWLVNLEPTTIPLPGALLFQYLPFYGNMRVWMRWGIYVDLFLAALAGFGVARLVCERSSRVAVATVSVLSLLIVIEFTQTPYPLSRVAPRPVDVWLAARPDPGTLVQLPPDQMAGPEQTFYTMFHRQPFIGAFYSAFPSPQFRRIAPRLREFPSADSIEQLRELGVRWVVVDVAKYRDAARVKETAEQAGLQAMTELDGQLVFRMR